MTPQEALQKIWEFPHRPENKDLTFSEALSEVVRIAGKGLGYEVRPLPDVETVSMGDCEAHRRLDIPAEQEGGTKDSQGTGDGTPAPGRAVDQDREIRE